jgi:hypothetical protein
MSVFGLLRTAEIFEDGRFSYQGKSFQRMVIERRAF